MPGSRSNVFLYIIKNNFRIWEMGSLPSGGSANLPFRCSLARFSGFLGVIWLDLR